VPAALPVLLSAIQHFTIYHCVLYNHNINISENFDKGGGVMETTVLRTRGNETLLKITGTYEAGGKTYDGTRYEWWNDNEKMDQGITSEEVNGELYIYCKGFSGMTDDQAIGAFEAGV
jgi:hypothetical protein